jgi:hypothetical protein
MTCKNSNYAFRFVLPVLALAICSSGCVTFSTMTPGKMEWIRPDSDAPRAGNAYLIRGFIGMFSGGIDALTVKIETAGVRAHVFQEEQRHEVARTLAQRYSGAKGTHEPIVLIGHSLGADDAILAARALDEVGVEVDLLVTIDATRPPKVPKNVKVCYNYYQPSLFDGTGILRGVPLKTEPGFKGELHNMNVRKEYKHLMEWDTNHVNIDKNTKIHKDVIQRLLPVCPPREEWAAARAPVLAGATTRPLTQAETPRPAVQAMSSPR